MHGFQLEEEVLERLGLTSLFGDGDGVERIHFLSALAVLASCAGERRFGIQRQFRETVIEHIADQAAQHIDHVCLCGTLEHLGQLIELILHSDTAAFRLGVGNDYYQRFLVVVHRVDRALTIVGTTRYVRPEGFDLRLNTIHIDVTHYNNSLIIRAIPFLIIVTQCLILKIIDHRRVPDHISFRVLRARVHARVHLFPYAPARGASGTPFLQDDATLSVYLLVQKQQAAAPIVHDEQRAIHDTRTISRHIGETIDRLINRGISIDVSTEVHTHRFKIIDDSFAGEMLGTIECHMLQEVRQTVLVILFEDSTNRLRDVELSTLLGLLIMTDIIGQSVFQLAIANLRVHGEFLRRLLRRNHHSYSQ